jgi:hypothetical protein
MTILGKVILAEEALQTNHLTTIKTLVEAVVNEQADKGTGAGIVLSSPLALAAEQYYAQTSLQSSLGSYAGKLLVDRVMADQPTVQNSLTACLTELFRQMVGAGATIERNVVGSTPTDAHADAPNLLTSTVSNTGKPLEGIIPETMVGNFSSPTVLSVVGGLQTQSPYSPTWPDGSSANMSLVVDSVGVLVNQSFDNEAVRADTPDGWIILVGVPGTSVSITNAEVQTIERTGTPTTGYFTISHTRSDGYIQTTDPLAFGATAADVETALRNFVGFPDVAVTWDLGTKKWTINFNAVVPPGNQTALTCANNFDTGGLTVAEVSAGGASYEYKSLAILGSAATELTTLRQGLHGLNLPANGVYAVSCQMQKVGTTTGNIYLELVDGANAVINDDAGTANRITINMATLSSSAFAAQTGFFRLPKILPAVYYFQIRLNADLPIGEGVYLDDLLLSRAQQLYTGGPYAALLANVRLLQAGDRYTIANTNGLAGKYQTWFWRWFGTLLPSDPSPSIADP